MIRLYFFEMLWHLFNALFVISVVGGLVAVVTFCVGMSDRDNNSRDSEKWIKGRTIQLTAIKGFLVCLGVFGFLLIVSPSYRVLAALTGVPLKQHNFSDGNTTYAVPPEFGNGK